MKCSLKLTITTLLFTGLPFSSISFADAGSAENLSTHHRTASYSQTTEQEMQQKQRTCVIDSYFGPVAPDQDVPYRNCEGKVLYGRIDAAGHGRLVDENGNIVMVVPTLRSN